MNQKRISLIVAVTLAAGTGFLTLNYLSSVRHQVASELQQQRQIIVASEDIPARVVITGAMLQHAQRRASEVEPDAIADTAKAIGTYSLISIPSGSTITNSKVGRPQDVALSVVLKPGMRAIAIAVDRVKDVAGLIKPGDRVDVIAVPGRVGTETPVATTILRGALVLALGAQLESSAPISPAEVQNAATVTLGVTPAQAAVLASADVNATLRLALRSPQESVGSLPSERLALPAMPVVHAPIQAVAPPPAQAAVPAPVQAAVPFAPLPAAPRPIGRAKRAPAAGTTPVIDGAAGSN
ncbi:MAG: pilus assembly protein CpaB [Candidatus Eremiobacteraeota bacterium]|jgi:pilus assembly protein CpaB|nr:pilus assembly protein CpaB [Candidatus Eremiobacteraeota bacterium]